MCLCLYKTSESYGVLIYNWDTKLDGNGMDNAVNSEAIYLVKKLLGVTPPAGKIPPLIIQPRNKVTRNTRNAICYSNPSVIDFLVSKSVIRVINILKINDTTPKDFSYKVLFRRNEAEEFLYVIRHGDFSWDKRDGTWTYKDRSHSFKLGTGQYKLINLFMEKPNTHFTEDEIITTYSSSREDAVKRLANDLIKEIRKPLKIPKEHFIPGDGYIFIPTL